LEMVGVVAGRGGSARRGDGYWSSDCRLAGYWALQAGSGDHWVGVACPDELFLAGPVVQTGMVHRGNWEQGAPGQISEAAD
jgi:hypothetical protein